MSRFPGPTADIASATHDERLAQLLSELTERVQRGEAVELEPVCQDHPDLATELRFLWGAVIVSSVAASGARSEADRQADQDRRAGVPPYEGGAGNRSRTATQDLDRESDAAFVGALPCRLGDYELTAELGRGGMGIVYRAKQLRLQRDVAVKMILRGALATHAELSRFRTEAEAAARLDHPGIVPVYEVSEIDGHPLYSMKLVDGETLVQRLSRGPLPAREAAEILGQVARAMHYAHQHGVLHRDLKPSNILLDRTGIPHVTDFGLAKQSSATDSVTRTGSILGTPAYMAPEQAAGDRGNVGPTSDVYSLGSILYHMLTGRPPFQSASPVDTVLMVLGEDPVPPRILNAKVNRDLELVALRCLQKPQDLRYPTAAALADDLEAFLKDEPLSVRTGRIGQVIARLFRETHHATVLENWGLLWMWHSLVLLVVCMLTNAMDWFEDRNRWHYAALWTLALWTWAGVFWLLRRRIGPVLFVERQIAHIWAAAMICIALLFPLEAWLRLDALTLSPILGLITGMVFLVKAGILSGMFYFWSAALFATAAAMAYWPHLGHLIYGVVAGASFFLPGLKYHRQRRQSDAVRLATKKREANAIGHREPR